jgi:hypothetical protein
VATHKRDGRVLAIVPVIIGVVFAALLFPRAVPPDDVPLPRVDERRLARLEHEDDARAARAATEPLPAEVRTLGEAIRAFNTAEDGDTPAASWPDIRASVDRARRVALEKGLDPIITLRAVQLRRFLDEVHAWQRTGEASPELAAVGGSFLKRMMAAGWVNGRKLAFSEDELRVAFKLKWNAVARFDTTPELEPTLDEMRALYTFYLLHPHAPEASREAIAAARKTARTRADCESLAAGARLAAEQWRLDKMGRIDPDYPLAFARGVALYRTAKYDAASRAFDDWLRSHPNGPLALRARNHLRAAMAASQAE